VKILLVSNTDWYLFRFRSSLANFLREQGNEVVFVSPPGRFVSNIREQGFRWLAWQVGRQSINPISELKAILDLCRIYSHEEPSLIHLHTIKPVIYGSLAARLARVPAIVNSITGRGYVFLGKDIRARLLRTIVKNVYRFILRSPMSMTIFENEMDHKYFLDENLVNYGASFVIEGVGVDVDHYTFSSEPDGIPVVAFAGRMLWDKGVGTFIDAVRLLHSKVRARFILVGEPDPGNPASIDVGMLNRWVNEGIVEWWGWRADMHAVFESSHIVVLPSFGEGLPTILLEAAATGRPIVATDVPGCRDVVVDGSTGFLVSLQNPPQLAAAIEKLIKNSVLRKSMGKAGREYIIRRFSSSKINRETYDIYQKIW
jgi:glycosyltransferase involved in cell wall biosynthesis